MTPFAIFSLSHTHTNKYFGIFEVLLNFYHPLITQTVF